jgi:hypothetical protein
MSGSLVRFRPFALALPFLVLAGCDDGERVASGPIDLEIHEVTEAGFLNPAAVLVDPEADVYLVSNVNGPSGSRDGNGFISRLSPDGEVLDLRWIDLTGTERAMHSPQGMAIRGDSLFVADLTCIRIFHRETGFDEGASCLEEVTHITDVDVGPEGSIFLVDSGLEYVDGAMRSTGTDAVYRLVITGTGGGSTLARGDELGRPRGISVGSRGIFVTTSESGEVFRLTPQGEKTTIFPVSNRHLDGLVFLPDGGFAFSSWSDEAVFLVTGGGQVVRLVEGLAEPGGLGFDPARNRLVVPLFSEGTVLFLDLPDDASAQVPEGG